MKTFILNDDSFYTNREWFIAIITAVCSNESTEVCSNFACSWQQVNFCDNLSNIQSYAELIYGDCLENYNVAYPINDIQPVVGSIVLMRYRGTVDDLFNVFEFVNHVGTGSVTPDVGLTAIQCSGDQLSATFSQGCVNQ